MSPLKKVVMLFCPALPGCVTQGESFEDAITMIKDAIEGIFLYLKDEGETIPQESKEIVITKVTVDSPQAHI